MVLFTSYLEYKDTVQEVYDSFYLVRDRNGKVIASFYFINIVPEFAKLEIAGVMFAKKIRNKAIGTEIIFLLFSHIFGKMHYIRCEWKCDVLNTRSAQAALRLGLEFERVQKRSAIYKNVLRDTACYVMLDERWIIVEPHIRLWLHKNNFDNNGQQKSSLSKMISRM